MQNYKGLYRSEPFPQQNEESRVMFLWQRYVQHIEKSMGVSAELTINELKELADLSTQATGDHHEVIFFSETFECPHQAEYYGIDVTGFNYSMVGENFFSNTIENGVYHLYDVINQYFRPRLNSNGLFDVLEDAISFHAVLNDLNELSPGCVEEEDWHIIHIFKVL